MACSEMVPVPSYECLSHEDSIGTLLLIVIYTMGVAYELDGHIPAGIPELEDWCNTEILEIGTLSTASAKSKPTLRSPSRLDGTGLGVVSIIVLSNRATIH
jgi:hypothetical protein